MRREAQFHVGDKVEYYRRGACYPGIVREDLGVLRGAGRRYRITEDDSHCPGLIPFDFTVAERHLCRPDWADDHLWGDMPPPWL